MWSDKHNLEQDFLKNTKRQLWSSFFNHSKNKDSYLSYELLVNKYN